MRDRKIGVWGSVLFFLVLQPCLGKAEARFGFSSNPLSETMNLAGIGNSRQGGEDSIALAPAEGYWDVRFGVPGMDGVVQAMAVSGSTLYVGGNFTSAGGVNASCIAKWDGTAWSALGSGMNGPVYALAVSGSTLYAGGSFTTAGDVTVNNIAVWDGTGWSALSSGVNGPVFALAVSGTTLYAGGSFSGAGLLPALNVAAWDGANWSSLQFGVSNTVRALAVSGPILYAGGSFTIAGLTSAACIAQWDGASWSAVGSGMDRDVLALAASGDSLYAGGFFTQAGGVSASHIAKWDGAGWSALGAGVTRNDTYDAVAALAVSGTALIAGGNFNSAGNASANNIARWDGTRWSALGSGIIQAGSGADIPVNALAASGPDLFAGGNFILAGNTQSYYVGSWHDYLALVTSPNGGENWEVGSTHAITWNASSSVGNIKLEYSTDNGNSWKTIVGSTPNDGSYAWTIPNDPSANSRVRVSDAAAGVPEDVSDAAFTIVGFKLISPNGGESWLVGSQHTLSWTSTGTMTSVRLELSTNNGTSWTTITSKTSNTGSYPWTVPNLVSSGCLIRVSEATDGAPADASDAVFSIIPLASITVTSPNGGENWLAGSVQNIAWTSAGAGGNVKIEYSTNGGSNYAVIIASTPNDGIHPWAVPNTPSTTCLVKVSDAATPSISDTSNAVFSILPLTGAILSLSRSSLNYGTAGVSRTTQSQEVVISNSGSGTLNWTATPNQSWIAVLPASGTGTAQIQVGVNPAGLGAGSYAGAISVVAPGAANSPQTVNVTLKVYAGGATSSPFGYFDTPVDGTTGIEGSVPVTGWALDDIEVTKVQIWRDPVAGDPVNPGIIYVGDALFVEGARPDVETAYPASPLNYRAGWGYMMLTNFLPDSGNGTFRIHAIANDKEGNSTEIGTKTITCDNAHATLPFGAIDTPAQGESWNGTRVNFGWALTPQPKSIATDGSTILLWIDGLPIGHPTYDNYRPDIATLFPGYANSNGAVGYDYVDTTQYANGVHTMAWSVVDSAAKASGIGSRYFTVLNTGTGSAAGLGEVSSVPVSGEPGFDQVASPTGVGSIPTDYLSPVYVKRGYNLEALSEAIFPDANGVIAIEAQEVGRIEVALSEYAAGESLMGRTRDDHKPAGLRSGGDEKTPSRENSARMSDQDYAGYLVVGNELRRLPVGSTFDAERGVFSWQLGPGFVGEYNFVFASRAGTSGPGKKNVRVRILPAFPLKK